MRYASKTTFCLNNLKILRPKATKNLRNFLKNFCEFPHRNTYLTIFSFSSLFYKQKAIRWCACNNNSYWRNTNWVQLYSKCKWLRLNKNFYSSLLACDTLKCLKKFFGSTKMHFLTTKTHGLMKCYVVLAGIYQAHFF